MELPDVLVCGAGGTLGEAWMRGLLHGLEDGASLDFRACGHFVGTSAGSIVAAVLAGGHRPQAGDDAARRWGEAAPGDAGGGGAAARGGGAGPPGGFDLAGALATPLVVLGRVPGSGLLRAAALSVGPRPSRRMDRVGGLIDGLGASFADGRLRIAAVDRGSGRRVVFGGPDAPAASVRDAVLASCAVPWIFAPVTIGGREYVDGGVWSPTNLDAAPARRGANILVLAPLLGGPWAAVRAATSAALRAERLRLRARVEIVGPDEASNRAMGPNLMDSGPRADVLAAGYAQGRAMARP
ncbi:MAG TPA: patatin-like phospholipase family protein [Solirubrobacteraceae bacterium]|jgi:NTE family protein